MKDKTKPVDFKLMSTYMGRSMTAIVALFVVVVAMSALLSGEASQRDIVDVCIYGTRTATEPGHFEPLRSLLGDATRRPVILDAEGDSNCDIYIMSIEDYVRGSDVLGVEAIYEIRRTERRRDSAVIIVRSSDQEIDYARLSADDVAFSSRGSMNGYFVQASILADRGFGMPDSPCELHFIGSEQDHSRVVLSVIHGRYRLGACRLSTLSSMKKNGVIGESEITVIGRGEALPEMLIAVPAEHVAYYTEKLAHISNQLNEVVSPTRQNETVELLKARGVAALEPADMERIEQARWLFDHYACSY